MTRQSREPARGDKVSPGPGLQSVCIFDTRIGPMGLAWGDGGVTRLQLSGASGAHSAAAQLTDHDRSALETRMQERGAAVPEWELPPPIASLVAMLQRYATGAPVDFRSVAVDLRGYSAMAVRIYDATRRLGWGEIASYGSLSRELGNPQLARVVGQAMARNPVPVIIPCHRVLASGGRIGGFSAPGGAATKERLLALEGRGTTPAPDLFGRIGRH